MATKKTKTAHTHQPAVRAVYRCRYCSQLFLVVTKPAPPDWAEYCGTGHTGHQAAARDDIPMFAWHNDDICLPNARGYGDLVAILLPGHPEHDDPRIAPTE